MRPILRMLFLAAAVLAVTSLPSFADPARRAGRMRKPTPEEAEKLRHTVQQVFQAARGHAHVATEGPDGLVSLVLDERYAVFSIAQIDGEGRLSTFCITGAAEAESRIAPGATDDSQEEE